MSEVAMNELPDNENADETAVGVPDGALPSDETSAPTLTVGQRLAAEREAKELTIAYVAGQLNLAPRQIQALESDNFAALPGLVSVRGFVRSYAKLLKIDADPLVALIGGERAAPVQQLEPKRSLSTMPFSDNLLMSDDRRSSARAKLISAIVVLLILAAVIVEWKGGWPTLSQSLSSQFQDLASASSSQNAAPSDVTSPSEASAAAVAMPKADTAPAQPMVVAASAKAPATNEPSASAAAPAAVEHAQEPAPHTEGSGAEAPRAASDNPLTAKNLLVMKVREDSWIEVRSGNNTLISRLVKAGSTESLEISQPVALTLGNAAGVDIVFRGNPLDLKSEAKNNVVRMNLK
jgi:cytoskeleton protein RodZ